MQVFLEDQAVFGPVEVEDTAEDAGEVGGGDGGDGTADTVRNFRFSIFDFRFGIRC